MAAGLCLTALMGMTSCNDDDVKIVDNAVPNMDLGSTQAWIENGKDLVVKGTITDNDGIAYIDIVSHDLLVDKRIDLVDIYGEAPTTYELNYKIGTSYSQIENLDSYPVEITVTDVAGNKTTQNLTARLDGDQTAPVFSAGPSGTMTWLVTYGEPAKFDINFTVSDNNSIDYIVIELEDATDPSNVVAVEGFPKRINVGKSLYVHEETVTMPDDQERTLNLSITAYDEAVSEESHSTAVKAIYKLSQQLPKDQPLWLCDVESEADMLKDIFGVPMLIENVGPNQYEARYFNEKAGTKVKILAQKSFAPIVIGPSKADPSVIDIKPDYVDDFVLDQAGVYYLITLNTETMAYNVSTYSIEDAIDPIMHMNYGGNDTNTWWDWTEGIEPWWQEFYIGPGSSPDNIWARMEQDETNPHIYSCTWNVNAGDLGFNIQAWHSNGWWNFASWRVTNEESFPTNLYNYKDAGIEYEPERFVYYGNSYNDYPANYFANRAEPFYGNLDYFEYQYGNAEHMNYMYPDTPTFELSKWGDEAYRKNFVQDNGVRVQVANGGQYTLIFDAHLGRAKLVPAN